ncbi:hypothetical protein [Mycobacterium lepromatosis]|uniref:hypothetical protein n=1 Tax=Mycobacterium lepromatosis TaxID=480418 RepID=UPI0005F81349|nr:hypothetical protein [Mycobacterium lepromatosis]
MVTDVLRVYATELGNYYGGEIKQTRRCSAPPGGRANAVSGVVHPNAHATGQTAAVGVRAAHALHAIRLAD